MCAYELPTSEAIPAELSTLCVTWPEAAIVWSDMLSELERHDLPYSASGSTSAYPRSPAADHAAAVGMDWAPDAYWAGPVAAVSAAFASGAFDTACDPSGAVRQLAAGWWLTEKYTHRLAVTRDANAAAAAREQQTGREQMRMRAGTIPSGLLASVYREFARVVDQPRYAARIAAARTARKEQLGVALIVPPELSVAEQQRLRQCPALAAHWRFGRVPCDTRVQRSNALTAVVDYWLGDAVPRADGGEWHTLRDTVTQLCGSPATVKRALTGLRRDGWGVRCGNGRVHFSRPANFEPSNSLSRIVYPAAMLAVTNAGGTPLAGLLASRMLHNWRNGKPGISLLAAGCSVWGLRYRTAVGGGRQAGRARSALLWLLQRGFVKLCSCERDGRLAYEVIIDAYLPPVIPAGLSLWRGSTATAAGESPRDCAVSHRFRCRRPEFGSVGTD